MAKTSGSNSARRNGGMPAGDSNYKGSVGKLESIVNIKNPQVYKSVKESVSRYHSVLGVRQKDIKLGEMEDGVGGVHITTNGKSQQVVINKKLFNGTKKSIEELTKNAYTHGALTKTNKAISHIVTHELAHATWNQHLSSQNAKAAGGVINKLFDKFRADTKKKGYGTYARTNVSEFWAEVSTKAVHGKSDKYTKAVKSIIKKYDL